MPRNDYRAGKAVLHCVVDGELMGLVRGSAAARGVSITRLVTEVLEAALLSEPQPNEASTPAPQTKALPDWDSILDRGRRGRVVSDTVSEVCDPLEEIA